MKVKKYLIAFILFVLCIPIVSKAANCNVVSGNGKNSGDEIACGTEHFYVLENKDGKVRMFAKYNLDTGTSIYKSKIEKEEGDTRTDSQYCQDLATSKGGSVVTGNVFHNEEGYCYYKILNNRYNLEMVEVEGLTGDSASKRSQCKEYLKDNKDAYMVKYEGYYGPNGSCTYLKFERPLIQSENATGAHVDENGNYLYPQVGDVYLSNTYSNIFSDPRYEVQSEAYGVTDPIEQGADFYDFAFRGFDDVENSYGYYVDRSTPENGLLGNLYMYKTSLEKMGFEVNDVSLLSLSELNDIVRKISNKSLPFGEWSTDFYTYQTDNGAGGIYPVTVRYGDIKSYIPSEYSWLYSTTYWNRSLNYRQVNQFVYKTFVFTASMGKICGSGYTYCAQTTLLGCGVRPVIEINQSQIGYNIHTETDDGVEIEVIDESNGNEVVSFNIHIDENHILKKLIILYKNGEELTFSNGEIINNQDGTISISNNLFTMPYEDVTIKAETDELFKAEVIKQENSTITVSKKEKIKTGESIVVTMNCNEGYEFKSLDIIDNSNNPISYVKLNNYYALTMPSSDVTVSGECSLITYSAEVIKEENGNVTLSRETEIAPNEEVTATIECNEGYEFDSLEVTDKNDNKVTLTDNKFSMPTSNVKVSGICKKVEEEPVTPDEPVVPDKEEPVVPSETDTDTPITSDNIIIYVVLLIISIISLVLVTKKLLTKKK